MAGAPEPGAFSGQVAPAHQRERPSFLTLHWFQKLPGYGVNPRQALWQYQSWSVAPVHCRGFFLFLAARCTRSHLSNYAHCPIDRVLHPKLATVGVVPASK